MLRYLVFRLLSHGTQNQFRLTGRHLVYAFLSMSVCVQFILADPHAIQLLPPPFDAHHAAEHGFGDAPDGNDSHEDSGLLLAMHEKWMMESASAGNTAWLLNSSSHTVGPLIPPPK
jgi:hypothetical protein